MAAYPIEYRNATGLLHREDGVSVYTLTWSTYSLPAVEYADGTKKWYVNGEKIEAPPAIKSSNKN